MIKGEERQLSYGAQSGVSPQAGGKEKVKITRKLYKYHNSIRSQILSPHRWEKPSVLSEPLSKGFTAEMAWGLQGWPRIETGDTPCPLRMYVSVGSPCWKCWGLSWVEGRAQNAWSLSNQFLRCFYSERFLTFTKRENNKMIYHINAYHVHLKIIKTMAHLFSLPHFLFFSSYFFKKILGVPGWYSG